MMQILKDAVKILFLLAGMLFIVDGYAQVSLEMKGGGSDGVSASALGSCTRIPIVASGGSYDGSSNINFNAACTLPGTLSNQGGGSDGVSASALGACSRPTILAAGGSYDGSSNINFNAACTLPGTLSNQGGGSDGVSASTLGACSRPTLLAQGGSYDGSSNINFNVACTLPGTLSNQGGGSDGVSASALGACSRPTLLAAGGSYDGSSNINFNAACTLPGTLSNQGGGSDGVSASALGACSRPALLAAGGSYDGSGSRALICNSSLYITSITPTSAGCQCDGTAIVVATGATLPYTYLWSSGNTSSAASGLCAGLYYVTVTDAVSNKATGSTTIAQTGSPITTTVSTIPALCSSSSGSATISASGGVPPYAYSWSSGATTSSVSNLVSGAYTVTLTDNGGCIATASATVSQSTSNLAGSVTTVSPACGNSGGTATISASGGTPPYAYIWSSGATASSATSLAAGSYTVTLTDNIGCTFTTSATISTPVPLVADLGGAGISCPPGPGNDGAASATISGGTAPYTYLWSTGTTSSAVSNLTIGTYNVTVTDASNCTVTGSYVVLPCNHLTMSLENCTQVSPTEILFDLMVVSDGSLTSDLKANSFQYGVNFNTGILKSGATITPSYVAGSGDFDGILSGFSFPASTTASHIRIVENVYTGTNAPALLWNQPYKVGTFRLTSSAPYLGNTSPAFFLQDLTSSSTTPTAALVYIENALFTTSFQNSGNNSGQRNLAVSCSLTLNPCNIVLTPSFTYVSCYGGSNGTASATFTGGYGTNKDWQWSNGTNFTNVPTNPTTITGLTAGIYSVTITDQALCTASTSVTVTEPLAVLGVTTASNTPVCIGGPINFSSTVTGGTTNYSYAWSGPSGFTSTAANPTYPNSSAAQQGNYLVTVTDAHSCTATATTNVSMTSCNSILSLNLYLEGYYQGSGFMRAAMYREGVVGSNSSQTDTISVILHSAVTPYTVVDSTGSILMTNGTTTVTFPFSVTGQNLYIEIKHRNTLQTWSKFPVTFAPSLSYDFTTANTQAYGDNLIQVDVGPSRWALYSGDMNQDQNIDLIDFPILDFGINQGLYGYFKSDLNGDGNVDLLDFPVLDANINAGVFSRHP